MLKPSFRLFIIPLGAICTLASLSSQNVTPRVQSDSGPSFARQQVVDCSSKSPSEVCVISFDSETSAPCFSFPPKCLHRPGRVAPLRVALFLQPLRSAFSRTHTRACLRSGYPRPPH